jgi:hypothetical protein
MARVMAMVMVAGAVAAGATLAGCGSSESTDSTATGAAGYETFGDDASPQDRAAAASAVQGFLRARADDDPAKECALMAASTKANLAGFGGGLAENSQQPCTELVESVRARIKPKALAQGDHIQVTGVRVDGDRGFVIYQDASGAKSAFAVVREGSSWKVGAIAGYRVP